MIRASTPLWIGTVCSVAVGAQVQAVALATAAAITPTVGTGVRIALRNSSCCRHHSSSRPSRTSGWPRSMISSSAGRNRSFGRSSRSRHRVPHADDPPPNRANRAKRESQIAKTGAPPPFSISPAAFCQPPQRLRDASRTTTHSSQRHQSLRARDRASAICLAQSPCSRLLSRSHGDGGRIDRGLRLPSSAAGYR
jgi:hypothetical protein